MVAHVIQTHGLLEISFIQPSFKFKFTGTKHYDQAAYLKDKHNVFGRYHFSFYVWLQEFQNNSGTK